MVIFKNLEKKLFEIDSINYLDFRNATFVTFMKIDSEVVIVREFVSQVTLLDFTKLTSLDLIEPSSKDFKEFITPSFVDSIKDSKQA